MRYEVVELRAYKWTYLIEAASEQAAQAGDGKILDEIEEDSYGLETLSIERVADDAEECAC